MEESITETENGNNISGNQLTISCITSNQNKFHLDSEGNLTVRSIIATTDVKEEVDLDSIYPVGSIYMNVDSTDPSTLFGGTWEQKRTFYGGELLAFASVTNGKSNYEKIAANETCSFSHRYILNKEYDVTNYVEGILTGKSDAILVKHKGIVGFVEAEMYISGLGDKGIKGFWWLGNSNALPTGVTLLPKNNFNALLSGPIDSNYGGNSNTYFYKITDEASEESEFYVNPAFQPYGGAFAPGAGGTKCYLLVKAYAKAGTTYMWERIA